MARVTDAEVQAIKPTTFDTTPHIDAANLIVNDINANCGKSFDETRLTAIELYLAAYFVGSSDPAAASRKFESASVTFQYFGGMPGLMSDKYGQMANMLSEGCLQQLDKEPAIAQFLTG